jgi:hypothetical protein
MALGLVFLGIGVILGRSAWNRLTASERVTGTVVELARIEPTDAAGPGGRRLDEKPSFAPVVQYQVGGQTYRIRGKVSSETPGYSVGESVTVLYSPDNPSDGKINSFAENWLLPLVFAGGGLLFILMGAAMLVVRLRSARTDHGESV